MIVVLAFVGGLFAVAMVVPQRAAATITSSDAILVIGPGYLSLYVRWTFSANECVEVRIYVNSIIRDTSFPYCYSSGTFTHYYFNNTPETGRWRAQIWSNTVMTELWAKNWDIPRLSMTTTVTPSTGGIGTAFVISSTIAIAAGGPDVYSGVGTYTMTAGAVVIGATIAPTATQDHYWQFYQQPVNPVYRQYKSTQIVSFASAGTYSVSANYTDGMASVITTGLSIVVINQFAGLQTQLNNLQNNVTTLQGQVTDLRNKNTQLSNDLNASRSQLSSAQTLNIVLIVVAIILAVVALALGFVRRRPSSPAVMSQQGPPPS
jgi:hypothetical protein